MDLSLIISLLSGAAGGNVAGQLMKNTSLGLIGNSLAGIVGGGIGGKLLALAVPMLAARSGGALDPAAILGQVAGGGIGGGLLMWIVGLIRART